MAQLVLGSGSGSGPGVQHGFKAAIAGHPPFLVLVLYLGKGAEQSARFSAAMLTIVAGSEDNSLTAVWQQNYVRLIRESELSELEMRVLFHRF